MTFISLESQAQARLLAQEPLWKKRIELLRKSYHSLIGDLWLAGITGGRFDRTTTAVAKAPLLRLFNGQVPRPNRHTILAWMHLCECGAGDDRFVLPQSIHPAFYTEQTGAADEKLVASGRLPTLNSLRAHLSANFSAELTARTKFYLNNGYRGPDLRQLTPVGSIQAMRPTWHDDHRMLGAESYAAMRLRRLVLSQAALVSINSPTDAAVLGAPMGMSIRNLTRHGLWIRTIEDEMLPWVADGSQIRIDSAKGAMAIGAVPHGTPPLWFGFNDGEVVRQWIEDYKMLRQGGVDAMENPFDSAGNLTGINPTWETRLDELGLISKPKSAAQTQREKIQADLDSMLNNFTF